MSMTAWFQYLRQKRQVPKMDARYAMADAYKALRRAHMEVTEFEAEINNCTDSEHAYRIALKWQAIANKKVVA